MALISGQVALSLPASRRLVAPLVALVCVLMLAVAAVAGWSWLSAPERFPLAAVQLDSQLDQVAEEELRQAISPYLDKGMLGLDIEGIRQAIETLPWVAEAAVRRNWPENLIIAVRERVAVAHWNDGLMDAEGRLFHPQRETVPPGLPVLEGPTGSMLQVWQRYQSLRQVFGQVGLEIQMLRTDERHAWVAELADGMVIKLGVDESDEAARRFVQALPRIGATADTRLIRVDLRYPNGFALAWSGAEPQSPRKK